MLRQNGIPPHPGLRGHDGFSFRPDISGSGQIRMRFFAAGLICAGLLMQNVPGRLFILFLICFKYVYFFTRIRTVKPEAV